MPTRTYTNVDFTGVSQGFTNNIADVAAIASVFGNFNVQINATGNDGTPGVGSVFTEGDWDYEIIGGLDFDAFPSIPDGAQITKVEIQIDGIVYGTCNAAYTGVSGNSYASMNVRMDFFRALTEICPDLSLGYSQTIPVSSSTPKQVTGSDSDAYTNTQTFDFTGAPIDKTVLAAMFTNWKAVLSGDAFESAEAFGIGASTGTDININTNLSGIRITVTYTDGPIVIVLDPSSGPVKIGQQITATGPNASEQTYAAIIDGKVVPIEPKIIGPDEVLLEVPYPSNGPCLDCFGDCPQCDDCLDACSEDLESEACQACMQACLDCLVNCLEDLALAEECQGSTGNNGGGTTTITIITGTQFGGSVELGSFTILVANGSGIYRFELGKTNDTIYDPDRDGTTYDVKIPNPGGTTGFFRS